MFLAALIIDGALAGVIYATIALAFVVVYKASRTINFALGEWIMLGSRMVATGLFQAMKSQGLIQAETLAQVLGRYDRARHYRS